MTFLHSTKLFMMFFLKICDFCGFRGYQGRNAHDFRLHRRYHGAGQKGSDATAIGGIEQGGKTARRPLPHHDCAAHSGRHRDHHPSIAACLRCKGKAHGVAPEAEIAAQRPSSATRIVRRGCSYLPIRMRVSSDTEARFVRYEPAIMVRSAPTMVRTLADDSQRD